MSGCHTEKSPFGSRGLALGDVIQPVGRPPHTPVQQLGAARQTHGSEPRKRPFLSIPDAPPCLPKLPEAARMISDAYKVATQLCLPLFIRMQTVHALHSLHAGPCSYLPDLSIIISTTTDDARQCRGLSPRARSSGGKIVCWQAPRVFRPTGQ
jgi:hypothetical protein